MSPKFGPEEPQEVPEQDPQPQTDDQAGARVIVILLAGIARQRALQARGRRR